MDLRDAPPIGLGELYLREALEKAVERSHWVLHNEAIRKAAS